MKKWLQCLLLMLGLFFYSIPGKSLSAQNTNSSTNVSYYNNLTVTTITTVIISGPTTNLLAAKPVSEPILAPPSTNNLGVNTLTNIMGQGGISSSTQKITSDIANNFIDTIPYWKNQIMNFDTVMLYNPTLTLKNKFGYFEGVDIPIANQASLGAGVLYMNNEWGIVPINVKIGLTINYPLLGNIYNYVATGPYLNVNNAKFGTYNFIGAMKSLQITKNLDFAVGFGIGDISLIKGLDYDCALRLNLHL